jgi:hypothetical protein
MRNMTLAANLLICLFLSMGSISQSYADSAEVLPKGVFRGSVTGNLYFAIDKRFDPDGKEEDIAHDFNATLNSSVFPDLALVEQGFGMPPGSANIGRSDVAFKYCFQDLIIDFQYGLLDRLSVGVKIPYYWNKTKVNRAFLNTSGATVGKNAALNTIAPLVFPGTVPLTTQDAQNLIGPGLDINGDGTIDIKGFGYKPIKTWSDSNLGDVEVGFRYQYLKTDRWRLAFTGGVRFPTGEVDDPDNLIDTGFGTGAWALLFRLNQDLFVMKNLLLNATFRYDLVLPDKRTKRIPNSVDQPITANEEKVHRNLGDVFELEASGGYEFLQGLTFSLLYRFAFKLKDHVSGNRGFAYESLEDETNWQYHMFETCLSYSTIPLFMAKKFILPLTASVSYKNVFAGENNFLKQQLFSLSLAFYF